MTDLPTPERRAELRHSIAVGKAFGMKDGGSNLVYGIELEPLLDATEPVADAEVQSLADLIRAAALIVAEIERLDRLDREREGE